MSTQRAAPDALCPPTAAGSTYPLRLEPPHIIVLLVSERRAAPWAEADLDERRAAVVDDEPVVTASRPIQDLIRAVERIGMLIATLVELRRHHLTAPSVVGHERGSCRVRRTMAAQPQRATTANGGTSNVDTAARTKQERSRPVSACSGGLCRVSRRVSIAPLRCPSWFPSTSLRRQPPR